MIEKLKKNEKPFRFMAPEEQECLVRVGNENLLYLDSFGSYGSENFGVIWKPKGKDTLFYADKTYAIKPDYKPEPEFVDLEIKVYDGKLGVEWGQYAPIYSSSGICPDFTLIHCLPSMPNFERCWYEGGITIPIDYVASRMSQKKKVYARFRT